MSLDAFKKFAKGAIEIKEENLSVMVYTRVSSKDQSTNHSLENQKIAAEKYAKTNNYNITDYFGGTYESASGDISRKEFMRLIEKIKKMKKKPFAILIYVMSRFSRSGGGGVRWAFELHEIGVNIIEVSSGDNTLTEEGKLALYGKLLKAREETLNKLAVSIPGMKKHLENGNWLGNVPLGYDHYGPRVKDYTKVRPEQKIVLNDIGCLLQQAWGWKMQNESDVSISKRLLLMGLKINAKKLSKLWRNPFYCGICNNKMLGGEVAQGRWQKMVSEEDFLALNDKLDGKRTIYKQEKLNPDRPLNGHIYCAECGSKMVGYIIKKKNVHYYKCLKCKGISINANTTPFAKKEGAHDLFKNLLATYQLEERYLEPFKLQLKQTFDTMNSESATEEILLKTQLTELVNKKEDLERKYVYDGLSKVLFDKYNNELDGNINGIKDKLEKSKINISNLSNYINISFEIVQNISKYWMSGSISTKRMIQKIVFPDGLKLDVKKRVYLTENINSFFSYIRDLTRVLEGKEKGLNQSISEKSLVVAGTRVELVTSGL